MSALVRLFVSDIDGCLSEPYRPYALDRLRELAGHARRAEELFEEGAPPRLPRVSLCSGRAYPYVEAVAQMLGLVVPVVFESGGGLFDRPGGRSFWNPGLKPETADELEAVRRWLLHELLPGTGLTYDYGKRMQPGIIGPDHREVMRLLPVVEAYVAERFPGLRVYHTDVSIDVLPARVTKLEGLRWLATHVGVSPEEMAYIGDTNGDIEALRAVGFGFAPANATEAVRRAVTHVTRGAVAEGVLEAYAWCVAHNERLLGEEPGIGNREPVG